MAGIISVRQQIIDALDERLKTILSVNGYNTDIGASVTAWSADPAEQSELPRIEYRDDNVSSSIYADNVHMHKIKVSIEVLNIASLPLTEMRKQEADLYAAIGIEAGGAGQRWGNLAVMTEPIGNTVMMKQSDVKVISLLFQFSITYRTLAWDMYTAV